MSSSIQNEYTMPLTVTSFDAGADDCIRLSAVLRYQQEAGERHLGPAGLGWCALSEKGMAFVTSRWHARIHRLPRMEERVTLTTWHRERRGPRFFRCYEWRDGQGELLIESVMQFALLSATDHRLLRGTEFDAFHVEDQPERTVSCADPARWTTPALSPLWDFTVRWSDTDRNGHMNNTRYGDLLCDALPGGPTGLTDVQLHFAGEAKLGETITLSAAEEAGVAYVRGTADGRCIFDARMERASGADR